MTIVFYRHMAQYPRSDLSLIDKMSMPETATTVCADCFVFQAERADSLAVGIPNERKAELSESVLQAFILGRAPCSDALHSALQL